MIQLIINKQRPEAFSFFLLSVFVIFGPDAALLAQLAAYELASYNHICPLTIQTFSFILYSVYSQHQHLVASQKPRTWLPSTWQSWTGARKNSLLGETLSRTRIIGRHRPFSKPKCVVYVLDDGLWTHVRHRENKLCWGTAGSLVTDWTYWNSLSCLSEII